MTNQIYTVSELLKGKVKLDAQVTVRGWVRTRRDSKAGISFIMLYDGSCFQTIQIVVPNTVSHYTTEILKLTAGCSLSVTGQIVQSQGKGQTIEIMANTVQVYGWVEDPDTYPISPKKHTLEYLRDYQHLRPRTNIIGAVMRVRHVASQAIHRFFHEHGFYWVHTPLLTTLDCEGAGEMFNVSTLDFLNVPRDSSGQVDFQKDFFSQETFLTVSGQLHAEAYCEALSRVYTFSPTFRAEKSCTNRHLAEFWMVEPEIAFADLNEDAAWAEALLKYVMQAVLQESEADLAFFSEQVDPHCQRRLEALVKKSRFEQMEYSDAIRLLEKSKQKFEFPVAWGVNLQAEHERYLTENVVCGPLIVMNYPRDIKSFYMRLNEDEKTVAAMDVLVPEVGELIGGSQREERYDRLVQRMDELKMNKDQYQWYLDLRRYGTVPHAGFGLGFERLLRYVTGIQAMRDVIPFPRYYQHAGI